MIVRGIDKNLHGKDTLSTSFQKIRSHDDSEIYGGGICKPEFYREPVILYRHDMFKEHRTSNWLKARPHTRGAISGAQSVHHTLKWMLAWDNGR